jgi:hypothetical protein
MFLVKSPRLKHSVSSKVNSDNATTFNSAKSGTNVVVIGTRLSQYIHGNFQIHVRFNSFWIEGPMGKTAKLELDTTLFTELKIGYIYLIDNETMGDASRVLISIGSSEGNLARATFQIRQ